MRSDSLFSASGPKMEDNIVKIVYIVQNAWKSNPIMVCDKWIVLNTLDMCVC